MAEGNVPLPDPTVLTTEQLERAVGNLKDLMEARIDGMERECDEKFRSVDTQFELVERQRVEQKKDTKDAVDAALAAAKEAVKEQTTASDLAIDKSEKASVKSIDQMGDKFDTAFEAQRRDIDDLKGRVGTNEARKSGGDAVVQDHRATFQPFQVAFLTLVGSAVVGLIIALLARV